MSDSVSAFAPASIGNVGVGFDMLGLALAGAGDRVIARRTENGRVSVAEVRGRRLSGTHTATKAASS